MLRFMPSIFQTREEIAWVVLDCDFGEGGGDSGRLLFCEGDRSGGAGAGEKESSACDDNECDKIASTSRVGLSEATSFLECSQEGKYSGHKIVSW